MGASLFTCMSIVIGLLNLWAEVGMTASEGWEEAWVPGSAARDCEHDVVLCGKVEVVTCVLYNARPQSPSNNTGLSNVSLMPIFL